MNEPVLSGRCSAESLARRGTQEPKILELLFAGLRTDKAQVKFACAKGLQLVSERKPELMLRFERRVLGLLEDENKIMQWNAMLMLGHMGRAASARRAAGWLTRLAAFVPGPVMISAANAMIGMTQLALAHPRLAGKAAQEILRAERGKYRTAECRNIAIGHAIRQLGRLVPFLREPRPVVAMVQRQQNNSRNATRKKAAEFLRRQKNLLQENTEETEAKPIS